LETGKLVAGPFESDHWVGAVRFSTDSKKLAVELWGDKCLEVWDIRSQKLDVRIGKGSGISGGPISAPIFWTNKNKNILAAFSFTEDDYAKTIYEFDASTLETVGTPFEGHTDHVSGLALSFDGALLASASDDDTIKLWAFESRQLLASFDVQNPNVLILSPDSCKLAYTTYTKVLSNARVIDLKDHRICICDTPPDILAQARVRNPAKIHVRYADIPFQSIARKNRALSDLLNVRVPFLLLITPLIHHHHCSLMQLVVLLLAAADRQYMPYIWRRDLRLQYTRSNQCSFASATFFASLLARMQYIMINFVIP
jgi:hypothetical protein